jgi:hypothetical protein
MGSKKKAHVALLSRNARNRGTSMDWHELTRVHGPGIDRLQERVARMDRDMAAVDLGFRYGLVAAHSAATARSRSRLFFF